jgi:hypothetical protein
MADTSNAQLTFRSWLRRGLATQQNLVKDTDPRASVTIDVAISGIAKAPSVTLALYGPGDVKNLIVSSVIRTWPKAGARNSESNYFPLIEFDQADLPWRYSPLTTSGNKIAPWLCVVAVPTGAAKVFNPSPGQPLAVLNVSALLLPDLSESDLWAHAQLHGTDIADDNALAQALDNQPNYFSSRILSLNILSAETEYTAYVVPTFEAGRLAGLGLDNSGVPGKKPAWTAASGTVSLPVYYQWSFETGPQGDFASLVRKIHPAPLDPSVGFREMDVANPGLGLPPAADTALPVEGALKRYPEIVPPAQSGPTHDTWLQDLTKLLNEPAELFKTDPTKPLVTPPLYGHWHAAQPEDVPTSPPWFHSLNEDPRMRVQAGASTLAVQREQQDLLAGAWDQVGAVRAANERARWAELAIEISSRLHVKTLLSTSTGEPDTLMRYTAPVQTRVLGSPVTIAALLAGSPVTDGSLSPSFRRITRPLGPISRRMTNGTTPTAPSLIDRMNRGEFNAAPPPPTPSGVSTIGHYKGDLVPSWLTPGVLNFLKRLPFLLILLAILLLIVAVVLFFVAGVAAGVIALVIGVAAGLASIPVRRWVQGLEAREALADGTITGDTIRSAPIPAGFVPSLYGAGVSGAVTPMATAATRAVVVQNYVTAAANFFDNIAIVPFDPAPLTMVSFDELRGKLTVALDPRTTIVEMFRSQIALTGFAYQVGGGAAAQINAGPSFPKPFYDAIKAVSQDWILPGVDKAQANTASLVVTNQKAVESFMVGANHEMSRTLLYNEYPTDLRFTYFQQFWDSRGVPGADTAPQNFYDIKPIHTWGGTQLGANTGRHEPPNQDDVVLFVRGEVLLRYPTTIVYAAKAVKNQNPFNPNLPALILPTPDHDGDTNFRLDPSFHGQLDPDIRFFGFPLSIQEALAGDGWFFVLQQHPGEPVFGFDVVSRSPLLSFKEVTWNMVLGAPAVDGPGVRAAAAAAPNFLSFKVASPAIQAFLATQGPRAPSWGATSADVAHTTLRRPTRVAYHAKEMIPS